MRALCHCISNMLIHEGIVCLKLVEVLICDVLVSKETHGNEGTRTARPNKVVELRMVQFVMSQNIQILLIFSWEVYI